MRGAREDQQIDQGIDQRGVRAGDVEPEDPPLVIDGLRIPAALTDQFFGKALFRKDGAVGQGRKAGIDLGIVRAYEKAVRALAHQLEQALIIDRVAEVRLADMQAQHAAIDTLLAAESAGALGNRRLNLHRLQGKLNIAEIRTGRNQVVIVENRLAQRK